MGYRNAADILPENLLEAIQAYIEGEVVYIPKTSPRKDWGEGSGSQGYYRRRNEEIRKGFLAGIPVEELAVRYGLARGTIRNIIYEQDIL